MSHDMSISWTNRISRWTIGVSRVSEMAPGGGVGCRPEQTWTMSGHMPCHDMLVDVVYENGAVLCCALPCLALPCLGAAVTLSGHWVTGVSGCWPGGEVIYIARVQAL